MFKPTLSRREILSTYLTHTLGWALFGAVATYTLLLVTFSYVARTEGLPYSWLPAGGFTLLCMGVGAFIGGASGVESGQIACYAKQDAMRAAARRHPASQPAPVETFPCACGAEVPAVDGAYADENGLYCGQACYDAREVTDPSYVEAFRLDLLP
jgi:hypothetical protein